MTREDALAKARAVLARNRAREAARRARRDERERRQAEAHAARLKADGARRLSLLITEGIRDARAIRATGRDTNGRAWT